MFERVILHTTEGPMKGKDFVLENGADCILGRSADCSLWIDDPFSLVSRHHCRIKVSAPWVHIQDLGSRNGTYINGKMIGKRRTEQLLAETEQREHAEFPLWQGDTLGLGDVVFQVDLEPPPPCADGEARDPEKLWSCDCIACS